MILRKKYQKLILKQMVMSTDKLCCIQCGKWKPVSEFNLEHILPRGFGNDGETEAVLEKKICKSCNDSYGKAIDKPFLRHVFSREIEKNHGMKRRHPKNKIEVTGSGVSVMHATTIAHVFECIKIAFETHIRFLGDEYRDNVFYGLRHLLSDIIAGYEILRKDLKGRLSKGVTLDKVWAEIGQAAIFSKHYGVICRNIYRLDRISDNYDEVIAKIESRSGENSYASLIQLGCWNFGIAVMVCLQSLPSMVVCVSNEVDRYINEYGRDGIHVMDLRSSGKWVGFESETIDNEHD